MMQFSPHLFATRAARPAILARTGGNTPAMCTVASAGGACLSMCNRISIAGHVYTNYSSQRVSGPKQGPVIWSIRGEIWRKIRQRTSEAFPVAHQSYHTSTLTQDKTTILYLAKSSKQFDSVHLLQRIHRFPAPMGHSAQCCADAREHPRAFAIYRKTMKDGKVALEVRIVTIWHVSPCLSNLLARGLAHPSGRPTKYWLT